MTTNTVTAKGFTLIELMATLAIATIITTVAVPAMGAFVVNHELSNAQQHVATALRKAKNLARSRNTTIRVIFNQDSSTVQLKLPNDTVLQSINLAQVTTGATLTFQFNAMGTVDTTGTVTLTSTRDSQRNKTVQVNTLFGQITLG